MSEWYLAVTQPEQYEGEEDTSPRQGDPFLQPPAGRPAARSAETSAGNGTFIKAVILMGLILFLTLSSLAWYAIALGPRQREARLRLDQTQTEIARLQQELGISGASAAMEWVDFNDVAETHWAYPEIQSTVILGYMQSCREDSMSFCPNEPLTRVDTAELLHRGVYGPKIMPGAPLEEPFSDLPRDFFGTRWIYPLWRDGFISGCSAEPPAFCPEELQTRSEGVVYFLRMVAGATAEPLQPEAQIFNDVPLDVWYARWVNAAYHAGIIQPCSEAPNLQFCPNKALTRAEAAYMLAHAKGWAMP